MNVTCAVKCKSLQMWGTFFSSHQCVHTESAVVVVKAIVANIHIRVYNQLVMTENYPPFIHFPSTDVSGGDRLIISRKEHVK